MDFNQGHLFKHIHLFIFLLLSQFVLLKFTTLLINQSFKVRKVFLLFSFISYAIHPLWDFPSLFLELVSVKFILTFPRYINILTTTIFSSQINYEPVHSAHLPNRNQIGQHSFACLLCMHYILKCNPDFYK
jgi:hypothetical protein